jgi:hypothetical protein
MTIQWLSATSEMYCVDSGSPVQREGDRCIRHGAASTFCYTSVRDPRCEHPRVSPNHIYPHCSECGRNGYRTPFAEAP